MSNNNKTPAIRFKGFTDTWEQRKLSDTLNFLSNNTLSRAELSEDTGTYKNVHYGDVLIKFGEYIDAQSTDLPYIADDEKAKKFESSKLQNGDIIIADTAEDEAVGKCVEIGNIGDLSIVSGLHTIPCRPKVKFAPAYLGFYLNSASYHDQLIPLMQGIKVTSISKSAISDTMISAPTNLSEQGKIGQFFTQLDSLITLHQRKYDKLIQFKAAMLQKMLPQNGADKPEIRFKGFTDAWEQRKLENITSLITKGTTPKDKSGNGEVNFIKVENIDPSSGIISSCSRIFLEEHEGYLKRSQLKENDILFSIAGTLGRTSVVNKGILPANTNQALAILRVSEGDISYLVTVLSGRAVSDFIKKNPTVGAQPNLSLEQVSNLEIPYPSIEEQQKIGDYFRNLDSLITLHQRKCDKYKSIKAGLIRKLFP